MNRLGPCPLCGGEALETMSGVTCSRQADLSSLMCFDGEVDEDTWNQLSAIAASERRMREALERCREWFVKEWAYDAADPDLMARICDEALKGGEG